jgi:methylase of polypeptide subunit release factors
VNAGSTRVKPLSDQDDALVELLACLKELGYSFVTPSPATHSRVLSHRKSEQGASLRDVLGWSTWFQAEDVAPAVFELLEQAGMLEQEGPLSRAEIRVSTFGDDFFLHSAYPTTAQDAVFFGPDSYRFARAIKAELGKRPVPAGARMLDIGTGSGIGIITAARMTKLPHCVMTDINPLALRLASVNARAAGIETVPVLGSGTGRVRGQFDFIMANPPFMVDAANRAYRNGGGALGADISCAWMREGLTRLAPGGRMLLYTGSAIVGGKDRLAHGLRAIADDAGAGLIYTEVDPDIFGEELEMPAYRDVERIAAVVALAERLV